MQESWLGIALMAGVTIIGLIVGFLLSKNRNQKKATLCAFIALAFILILFYVIVIYYSVKWSVPIFIFLAVLVPIGAYVGVYALGARDAASVTRRSRSSEAVRSNGIDRADEEAESPKKAHKVEKKIAGAAHMKAESAENTSKTGAVGETIAAEDAQAKFEPLTARKQRASVESFNGEPSNWEDSTSELVIDEDEMVDSVEDGAVLVAADFDKVLDDHLAEEDLEEETFADDDEFIEGILAKADELFEEEPEETIEEESEEILDEELEGVFGEEPETVLVEEFEEAVDESFEEETDEEPEGEIVEVLEEDSVSVASEPIEDVLHEEVLRPRYGRGDYLQDRKEDLVPAQIETTEEAVVVEPEPEPTPVTEVPFAACFQKADTFKEKGLHAIAARLYAECAHLADNHDDINKALFESMGSYIKADQPDEAKKVALILKDGKDSLTPIQSMKLDAVLRMI